MEPVSGLVVPSIYLRPQVTLTVPHRPAIGKRSTICLATVTGSVDVRSVIPHPDKSKPKINKMALKSDVSPELVTVAIPYHGCGTVDATCGYVWLYLYCVFLCFGWYVLVCLVEAFFGVGSDVGSDTHNDDGCTNPKPAKLQEPYHTITLPCQTYFGRRHHRLAVRGARVGQWAVIQFTLTSGFFEPSVFWAAGHRRHSGLKIKHK